jgi:hypothetical protein
MATKAVREQVKAVTPLLKANAVGFHVEERRRGPHPKLILTFTTGKRKIAMAETPGDVRGLKNFMSEVRSIVKSMQA